MVEEAPLVSPAPMEGQGGYNRNSRVQAAGLSPAVPPFERAARTAALARAPEPVMIADYGASEGHNSVLPLAAAIRVLRERVGRDRAISVVHTDLPENDFADLFETLIADPASYMRDDPAVFPFAVGRSFYEQILPSGSVTLGWSSWAVHWLSRMPALIPDQLQVAFSHDEAARAAFSRQAAEDWRSFLAARGRELRPGGKLVVVTLALTDEGKFGWEPVLPTMYAALLDMAESGFLRAEEMHRMGFPTVARSRADFLAPFGPEGRFGGLSVEDIEIFFGEDRIWEQYERDGDAQAFGARWAAFSRASAFQTFAAGLDGGRADPRAASFVDRLEAGMAARLAAAPERALIPLARILLTSEA